MGRRERARNERVDAWLAQGGLVLASTERVARSVTAALNARQRAGGRLAWPTPEVHAWDAWVRERWRERNSAGLMLLNRLQEQSLWARVIRQRPATEGILNTDKLAASAMQAYRLLWSYAPKNIEVFVRSAWPGDAAVFSGWLTDFESRCRREAVISESRIVFELSRILRGPVIDALQQDRQPLLLIGFDRLLTSQEELLAAWGAWQSGEPESETPGEIAPSVRYSRAPDAVAEVNACAAWLRRRLSADPEARLMVVTTGLQARRGELERAFLAVDSAAGPGLEFEFSLGVSLAQVALVRGALLLMRWMFQPLSEPELDWLLTSGSCAASADEETALAAAMLALRHAGMERPEWTLEAFCEPERTHAAPPAAWVHRLNAARQLLDRQPRRQSPLEWASVALELLEAAGWPGFRPASSIAFQARRRWQQVLEECGSLGFESATAGEGMDWAEFVRAVSGAVSDTIFAAESKDAAILITEPVTSAGLVADGIWFLGAHEANWPGSGQPHPLLPIGLQREAGMPHASAQADWTLALETTRRLLRSADEVIFSYARQVEGVETRPSRLVEQLAGQAGDLPIDRADAQANESSTTCEVFEDRSRIPFPLATIPGGAATLTLQSLCPFQAFAKARLATTDWDPAEIGLNARQRGLLLHEVMGQIWSGQSGGITSLDELREIGDLSGFVSKITSSVIRDNLTPAKRSSLLGRFLVRFPKRILELETERLTRLLSEWLAYERVRQPFTVAAAERDTEVTIAGLRLRVRLDRVDLLEDGGRLVIDYKTSSVGPSAWEGERPDDVQLPLYATFAVQGELEGLVFASLRPGKTEFSGRVRNAAASLKADLGRQTALVKNPLTDDQLYNWRQLIEQLGDDFLHGRAAVDPKDPIKTCERCRLHAVCRISDNRSLAGMLAAHDGEDSDAADDGGERDV
jgi:ATP-dependent helicase/nuclease subunit B